MQKDCSTDIVQYLIKEWTAAKEATKKSNLLLESAQGELTTVQEELKATKLKLAAAQANCETVQKENQKFRAKLNDLTEDRNFIESLRNNLQKKYQTTVKERDELLGKQKQKEEPKLSFANVPKKEQIIYIKHGKCVQYDLEKLYRAFLEIYDDQVTVVDAIRIMVDHLLELTVKDVRDKDLKRCRFIPRCHQMASARPSVARTCPAESQGSSETQPTVSTPEVVHDGDNINPKNCKTKNTTNTSNKKCPYAKEDFLYPWIKLINEALNIQPTTQSQREVLDKFIAELFKETNPCEVADISGITTNATATTPASGDSPTPETSSTQLDAVPAAAGLSKSGSPTTIKLHIVDVYPKCRDN